MREPPNLEIINRALGQSLRKSEDDVNKLRQALSLAASALYLAGYHQSADNAMEVWKETAS